MKFKTAISFFATLLLAALFVESSAVAQVNYVPDEDSRLWIEGRSNINQFECIAQNHEGAAVLFDSDNQNGSIVQNFTGQASIRVDIDVFGFECGRNRMNRDLRDALKAGDHPKITFIFGNVIDVADSDDGERAMKLEINGTLTVAGITREVHVDLVGYLLDDGRLRAVGSKKILMTDFDVEPPTAMMGLVKAEDELTVHFDLIAKRE
jgi:polyisoprenoid-binding protein YceI